MKFYIGIDLGGMSAKAGLMDETGKVLCVKRCATNAADGAEGTAALLSELVKALAAECGYAIEAVGIGSPGVIDSKRGNVVTWSNFGWKDVPLGQLAARRTGLPVYVANDANAAALGEAKFGSGKGCRDSVTITLGTGVGGGIVSGGKLLEGYRSAGGELGHTVIRKGGVLCSCGRRGCLECYASATALKRETRAAMERHPDSLMWKLASPEQVSGKTAFEATRLGDKAAASVVKSYCESLGEGIANIVNLLRPEIVILGGGVSNEGEYLLSRVERFVKRHIYVSEDYAPLRIVQAALGSDAGLYGACAYAMERSAAGFAACGGNGDTP